MNKAINSARRKLAKKITVILSLVSTYHRVTYRDIRDLAQHVSSIESF